jgi:hypothetical protein
MHRMDSSFFEGKVLPAGLLSSYSPIVWGQCSLLYFSFHKFSTRIGKH